MPQRIAAMPMLLQCLSALPQYLFQCSYCRNIAAMLMLLAMPFNIAAACIATILKRIAAMLPLLHHCGNTAIAKGIAAMPFGIAATPQYFPDVGHKNRVVAMLQQHTIALLHVIAAMPVLPQYCLNAHAAYNIFQHCHNTYCRNIDAHCQNAPCVAPLRECCCCKGIAANALCYCCNNLMLYR